MFIQNKFISLHHRNKQIEIMNQYVSILEKSATQIGLPFEVNQSDKSEAAYLLIYPTDKRDFYNAVSVRLASHDASTAKSAMYSTQLDCGFNFDYSSKLFSTTWGLDSDGDFSECSLEDELFFETETEMIDYMVSCLVPYLQVQINNF